MRKYYNFSKALENLKEGSKLEAPYNIVEQTGLIGLFEICFEQSWKLMKEILEEHGRFEKNTGSPKAIIKTAYQCGMINDCEAWLELLETQNLLAHTYSNEQALSGIKKLKNDYLPLFETLKKEIDENWLLL